MNKIVKLLIYFLIGVNVYLSAWFVLHNDIIFHTDIARDFLLIADIVDNRHLALLGPRSGGIPGVFHGPLWLYMQVPAFVLGHGNPVAVGWFWIVLSISLLVVTYFVAKKLFGETTALLATLLLSLQQVSPTKELFNPFGAVLFAPLYFYFFYSYIKTLKVNYLVIALFILGLIIQCQMAWGVPILILTVILLSRFLYKHKKLQHFSALLILLIPLSTFILFELKHQFLQTHAVLNFITGKENSGKMSWAQLIPNRFSEIFNSLHLVEGVVWLNLIGFSFFGWLIYKLVKKQGLEPKKAYLLYIYFFGGFWLMAFLFRGVMWGYYYWPFLSLTLMVFASLHKYIPKYLFYAVFVLIVGFNQQVNVAYAQWANNSIGQESGSWKFNLNLAEKIFNEHDSEFGYYVYTPDLLGYSPRYAMDYDQKKHPTQKAFPFEKKKVTYLIIAPPPSDRLELNGDWWKMNQVKIAGKPVKVMSFPNGFKVEKYELTPEEIQVASDPNLNIAIHFR